MLKEIVGFVGRVAVVGGIGAIGYLAGKIAVNVWAENEEERIEEKVEKGWDPEDAKDYERHISKESAGILIAGAMTAAGVIGIGLGASWLSGPLKEVNEKNDILEKSLHNAARRICAFDDLLLDMKQDHFEQLTNLDISAAERTIAGQDLARTDIISSWYKALVTTPSVSDGIINPAFK